MFAAVRADQPALGGVPCGWPGSRPIGGQGHRSVAKTADQKRKGQLLALLVENRSGVLSRVVGLFSQRGYNIETLNVAPTQDPTLSRITLTTSTDKQGTEQVVKQLNKLVDVVKVIRYDPSIHVAREMALVQVRVTVSNRAEILSLCKVFRARVVDARPRSYIFEVTGHSEKVDAFIQNVQNYGIQEVYRTGGLALPRSAGKKKAAHPNDRPEGS